MHITETKHVAPEAQATTPAQLAEVIRDLYGPKRGTTNNAYMGAPTVRFTAWTGRRQVTAEFTREEWEAFLPMIQA